MVTGVTHAGHGSGLSDAEAFGIAFQADGHLSDRYTGERCGTLPCKFSLTKERKKERLRILLASLQWVYTEKDDGKATDFVVDAPVAFKHYIGKDFAWVKPQGPLYAKQFIDELQHWDGYTSKDRTCIQYTNTNEAAIDAVQVLAVLGGYTANKYKRIDKRKETYKPVYNLFIRNTTEVKFHKATVTPEHYSGMVYCPNVPTGMFIMRQNGKAVVTGNCHMNFAFEVVNVIRKESPHLFDRELEEDVGAMLKEAVELETTFAKDALQGGVSGLSAKDINAYLQCTANAHMRRLGFGEIYPGARHHLDFMEHQGMQGVANFFERRVSEYAVNVTGEVRLDEEF
jgi:hypothetical protein